MRTRLPKSPVTLPSVENVIHTIRGERVILDADLAKLYGVPTKVLNQALKRNRDKFPPDFLLQLTTQEMLTLNRSQIVTGSPQRHRDLRSRPFAFTEHGAIMAANILNSPQAVQMSVFVVRAFIKMRGLLTDTRELAKKLVAVEKELTSRLDSHETAISEFMRQIMLLLAPPPAPDLTEKEMGFHTTFHERRGRSPTSG